MDNVTQLVIENRRGSEMDSRHKVLIVEDEAEIRQLIELFLRREGFHVDVVEDGYEAQRRLPVGNYSLVVLDWMLPGLSGLEITRWMRTRSELNLTPILFVTAKAEPENIASGLDAGADDYLPKPFDTAVLLARVKALLRRRDWLLNQPKHIVVGQLRIDEDAVAVFLGDEQLQLTRSEFKLLAALMKNQGKVLSREKLIEEIQGEGVNVIGRTVDTHVFGLRKKLLHYSELIETIRGVGYRVKFVTDLK